MIQIKQIDYTNKFIGKLFRKSKVEHTWLFSIDEYKFKAIILESVYTDRIRFYINHHCINFLKSSKKQKLEGIQFSVPGVDFFFVKEKQDFKVKVTVKQNFDFDHCFWKQVFCQQIKELRKSQILASQNNIEFQGRNSFYKQNTLGWDKKLTPKNRSVDLQSHSFKNFLRQSLLEKNQLLQQDKSNIKKKRNQIASLNQLNFIDSEASEQEKYNSYRDSLDSRKVDGVERDSTTSKKLKNNSQTKYKRIDQQFNNQK